MSPRDLEGKLVLRKRQHRQLGLEVGVKVHRNQVHRVARQLTAVRTSEFLKASQSLVQPRTNHLTKAVDHAHRSNRAEGNFSAC